MARYFWAGIVSLTITLVIFHHVLSVIPDQSCDNTGLDPEISKEYTSSSQAKCRKVKHQ
jgi:hypothetical protein